MSHDYTNQSTEEDPRMMAFFDSLVQRELEGWSTDTQNSDSSHYNQFVERSASDSDTSSVSSVVSRDEDGSLSPFTMAFASAMQQRSEVNAPSDGDELRNAINETNSFLDRLDDVTEASSSTGLVGQRPNSLRKSIGQLIHQKRKEYLKSTKRSLSTSSSESESSNKPIKTKVKRHKKVVKSKHSKQDSNSDSSDEEENSIAATNAADIFKNIATERSKQKERLRKIQKMRKKALFGSDSSDEEDVTSECASTKATSSCSVSSSYVPNFTQVSSVALETGSDQRDAIGNPQCSSSSVVNGSHIDSDKLDDPKDKSDNKLTENGKHDSLPSLNNDCSTSNSNNASSEAAAPEGTNEQSQPTWTQFKRFKKKVEKARRQYRRASTQESATCSSADEN